MRKILIFLGIILIGITLVGCSGSEEITIPKYLGVTIDSNSPESGGELVTFYKAKNDVAKVEIEILNPSNVPITSIVINGHKYFSARFYEDSTNQLVKFDFSTGNNLGEAIYHIDEVVYDDGSISKSVLVNTDNTFKLYIHKNAPTVTRESYVVLNDSIQVDFVIEDVDNVISENSLVAELFSGEIKVDEIILTAGNISAVFNDLPSDNHYEVKVRASYDLDDNNGINNNILLFSDVFVTFANSAPIAIISNAFISSDEIVLNVSYTDSNNVTIPGSIYVGVFKDDVLEEMVSIQGTVTGINFRNLLSNQSYEVKVLSDYNLNNGSGDTEDNVLYSYAFTTTESIVPVPQIINLLIEENRVSFDIQIDDQDDIIHTDTLVAKLYVDGELKQTAPIEEYKVDLQLYNLLSGFEFTVEIEASYDLNDGSPVRTDQIIYTGSFATAEKTIPQVNVSDVIIEQGYVTLELTVEDPHSTIQNALIATLYENDVAVQTIQFNNEEDLLIFNYLVQYEQIYTVNIVGNYNLQDGSGIELDVTLFTTVLVTENQKAPVVELNNVILETDLIELDVRVMDSDDTIIDNIIIVSLYNSGVHIESKTISIGTTSIFFENLFSNTEYQVLVTTDYEVNDGSGVIVGAQLKNELVITFEKAIPEVYISDLDVDTDSVTVYYDVEDPHGAIVTGTLYAMLTLNNTQVGEIWPLDEDENTALITGLTSGLRYEVEIYTDYNLNDGMTTETGYLLDSSPTPIPAAKDDPEAILENIISDNNSITFDAIVIDDDDAITGNLKAVLYKDGVLTMFEVELIAGEDNVGTVLSDLEFGVEYEIRIIADYSYNDGTPPFIAEELASDIIATVPIVIIANVIENEESITYTATIDDLFGISDSPTLQISVYDQGDNLVGSVYTVSSGTTLNLLNLWSDYDYYIVITGSYSGVTGEVARYVFHTEAKIVQPLVITNLVVDEDEVQFDVDNVELPDSSDVIFDDVYVYIYEYDEDDGVYEEIDREKLNDGNNSVTFDIDGFDGTQYVIQIEADINLNDSYGDYDDYVIHSQSFIYTIKNSSE
jgi:hypothetical protein